MTPTDAIDDRSALQDGLRLAAVALTDAEIPFALVGGYAAWARGAPEPSHDADFAIVERDVDRAKEALAAKGLDVIDPAENWLFKAYHHGQLVDVLFRMVGEPITDELLARSDVLEVLAVRMPVLGATDIVSAKLRVLGEHCLRLRAAAGHRARTARADRLGPGPFRRRRPPVRAGVPVPRRRARHHGRRPEAGHRRRAGPDGGGVTAVALLRSRVRRPGSTRPTAEEPVNLVRCPRIALVRVTPVPPGLGTAVRGGP